MHIRGDIIDEQQRAMHFRKAFTASGFMGEAKIGRNLFGD